jgi:sterol 3beta-glucosyltransferase
VDQPLWGARVHALGAGPKPIPQKKLTADKLAAAITAAVTDSSMIEKADGIGEQIRAEDGIGNAVRIIEKIVGS